MRQDDANADAFRFRLFAAMWALAALFHVEPVRLAWLQPALAPKVSVALVTLAAVATCWRPSVGTLVVLALAQLVDVAVLMPAVPNHWLLAGFVNLAWLLAWIGARRPETLMRRVRAPLLVSVAVFYAWTGLWKLNTDFSRPEVSCALVSWERVLGIFRWLPDAPLLARGVIASTLLMELVGPLLLLLPVTRRAALVVFVAFHLGLGLDMVKVYLNFSSVMFALLLLFLPDTAIERLRSRLPAGAARLPGAIAVLYLGLAGVGLAAGLALPVYVVGRWVLWLEYALVLLMVVLLAVVGARRPARWLPAGASASPAWIVPVLIALNGLAPILGLKTRTSWQMYSNVRLEAATSNHLLFPPSLDLLGALEDPVTGIEGGGTTFQDVAGTGLALPWIEFRRRIALDPGTAITWEHGGERHVTTHAADDPALSKPLPLPARKLMIFRPLGPGAEARCDW